MQDINQELLHTIAKSISKMYLKPDSRILHEEELLLQIAHITDDKTSSKAKDMFHSSKNVYCFDDYLFWLSKLLDILLYGVPPDEAFAIVHESILRKYQEPLLF